MPKILVTGASGFVGQHVIHELEANNYDVVAVGGRGDQIQEKYQALDLSVPKEAAKIDFTNIDGVIHLAGLAAVGPSFNEPTRYIATNAGIEANLFETAMAQGQTPRFVIVSTGALYDSNASLPLTEASATLPSSPYAVSKLTQELLAQYYVKRGFECIIARPFNHIGPGQNLGFIVPDLTQQVLKVEKGEQPEVLVGNLDAQRDYTDVRDIAHAYRLLFEKGISGETYNVCSGTPYSGHDILEGIASASGVKPTITVDPERMRPSDNPIVYGDHSKLTQDTGWEPKIALAQTLGDVVADWRSRN